jgi:uncharacterized protein (TIGR01244 family)
LLDSHYDISKRITAGSQPESREDIEQLVKKGFKTIVNLSKAGEIDQVFKPDEEQEIVESLGLDYVHLPVSLSNVKDQDILNFCELVAETKGRVFVHCRIGQRAEPFSLIFHGKAKNLSAEQALEKGKQLGLVWDAPILSSLVTRFLKGEAS